MSLFVMFISSITDNESQFQYFGQSWIYLQKFQLDMFSTTFCNPVNCSLQTQNVTSDLDFVHTVVSRFSQPILTVASTEKKGEGVATTKHKNHLLSFWRLWKILSLHSLRIIQLIYFLRKWILSLGKVDPWLGSWKYEASKVPNGPHTSFMSCLYSRVRNKLTPTLIDF